MRKLRIGFEITDNYNYQAFRNFLNALKNDPTVFNPGLTEVELFLISCDDSSAYIYNVGLNLLGLDINHVIVLSFASDKPTSITDNKIDIYFDNLQSTVLSIDTSTDAYAILVDSKQDMFNVQPKYISDFRNVLNIIEREDEEQTAC